MQHPPTKYAVAHAGDKPSEAWVAQAAAYQEHKVFFERLCYASSCEIRTIPGDEIHPEALSYFLRREEQVVPPAHTGAPVKEAVDVLLPDASPPPTGQALLYSRFYTLQLRVLWQR
jgi:hypothetical protein